MKINYGVRSKVKGQPATVYLRYTESRDCSIEVKTPEKVYPEHWSGKGGRWFKPTIAYNNIFTEQKKVDMEKRFVELRQHLIQKRLGLKTSVTKEWLSGSIDGYYMTTSGTEELNEYIARFIAEMESGRRLNGTRRYGVKTSVPYKSVQVLLWDYQGIYSEKRLKALKRCGFNILPNVKKLSFNDITTDFVQDFITFCNKRGYKQVYTCRVLANLRRLMRISHEEGLHSNTEFQRRGFMLNSTDVENVYLNETEIRAIFDLDMSDESPLKRNVRDIFLAGCYTSQRFSDYSKYKKECIKEYSGKRVLEFIQDKTGVKCIVPIRPELEFILEKHNYNLPKMSVQEANKHIKTICEKAKIDELINYEEYKGGFRVKKSVPKWKLVKTHTARRSGATNMYLAGIPTLDIMKIGGWKTESAFLKYIKVTQEQTAVSLASHPFFMGNVLSVAN